jgi:hypothetical protein
MAMTVPGTARLGFQVPDWKGAPWCPIQEVLIKRPHWIVEAVPKDKYYLYGKIVLRFDKDFFLGSYSTKYDWNDKLIASFVAVRTNFVKVGPGEFWAWIGGAVATALNWKLDRATTSGHRGGRERPCGLAHSALARPLHGRPPVTRTLRHEAFPEPGTQLLGRSVTATRPCRRQPIRASHVRAAATGGGPIATGCGTRQPVNHGADEQGSTSVAAFRCFRQFIRTYTSA